MSIEVKIPTVLRRFANDLDTIELDGTNVGQVLEQLSEQFPDLKKHLFSDDGQLRNFVNVFVNDENIRDLRSKETALRDGDQVILVPSVAGGIPSLIHARLG